MVIYTVAHMVDTQVYAPFSLFSNKMHFFLQIKESRSEALIIPSISDLEPE